MEVGLFQTQKGATVKILRSQVAPRHPDMIFYTLYGEKGFRGERSQGWMGRYDRTDSTVRTRRQPNRMERRND